MKFLLVSLVFVQLQLLVVSFSAQHNIVKRKAEDGKFYVWLSLKGCAAVNSSEPCQVNSKLMPYFAKHYETRNWEASVAIALYEKLGINRECKNEVTAIMCSQFTAKCFEDEDQVDFGDIKTKCEKMYNSCPKTLVDEFKKAKFCETVNTGKLSTKCVFATERIAGGCPQPKSKMPLHVLKEYTKTSLDLKKTFDPIEQSGSYSNECIKQLKEMTCEAAYCSEDEEKLLIKSDQEDYDEVIKLCFKDGINSFPPDQQNFAKQLKTILMKARDGFPRRGSAQLVPAPPTAPPTSASNHLSANLSLLVFILLFFVKFALKTM